jgi:hypothetical protein
MILGGTLGSLIPQMVVRFMRQELNVALLLLRVPFIELVNLYLLPPIPQINVLNLKLSLAIVILNAIILS